MNLVRLHGEPGRELWIIEHALAVGGLALGAHTSVLRLADGGVALHSPGPLTEEELAAIEGLGPVRALIGPNLLHHLSLPRLQRRFTAARLYAPLGLARKQPSLRIDAPLSEWPYPDLLLGIPIGGMPKVEETAFVHRPSRTLLLADLCFNLRPPAPLFTRLFMRANGGFDRFGPTRLLRSTVKDRRAARRDLDRLLTDERAAFDRVVVGHGEILPSGGHEAVRAGFAWLEG